MELFASIDSWHWWGAGILFLILELFAPATFFLWLAVSALLVGCISWLAPELSWQIEFLLFAIFSVVSLVGYRMYLSRNPIETDAPTLNRRGEQYIGQVYELVDPIVNGYGKVKIGDSIWKVKGVDAEVGNKVKVIAVDGIILQVELL